MPFPRFLQQCPARNKLPLAMGRALKKKSVHFASSPFVSLPMIQTIIREVIKMEIKQVGFMVNSIKFSVNYCTASHKLSCKSV